MKKVCAYLAIIVFLSYLTNLVDANDKIFVSKFCERIHKRTFFLLRLEKTMKLFSCIHNNEKECLNISINTINLGILPHFNHSLIQEIVRHKKQSKKLAALLKIWEYLRAYKSIEDTVLLQEFTKLVLIFSTHLIINDISSFTTRNISQRLLHEYNTALSLPACIQLDYIDTFMEYFAKIKKKAFISYFNSHIPDISFIAEAEHGKSPDILLLYKNMNYTEALTRRNYHIHRINNALHILVPIQNKLLELHEINQEKLFKHRLIVGCIEKMCKTKTVHPLLKLAQEIKQYKLIQDDTFLREFLVLLFITYKIIIMHTISEQTKSTQKTTFDTILHLYETIEQLPLEEILDAIDLVAEELPGILEKYEFDSNVKWKVWLRKYWWVPPVVLSTFVVKIALKHKLHELGNHFSTSKKPEKSGDHNKNADELVPQATT